MAKQLTFAEEYPKFFKKYRNDYEIRDYAQTHSTEDMILNYPRFLTQHPDCPREIIERMVNHPSYYVRENVACNTHHDDLRDMLVNDESACVRWSLVCSTKNRANLVRLKDDSVPDIRKKARDRIQSWGKQEQ
jgi:hypothetical protein